MATPAGWKKLTTSERIEAAFRAGTPIDRAITAAVRAAVGKPRSKAKRSKAGRK